MKHEVQVASSWWAKQQENTLGKQQALKLQQVIEKALFDKIQNHWYENEKYRGSGYRAVSCDEYKTDDLLTSCSRTLGVDKFVKWNKNTTMFINPGEVIVKIGNYERIELYRNQDICAQS
eukprot:gene9071-1166_t